MQMHGKIEKGLLFSLSIPHSEIVIEENYKTHNTTNYLIAIQTPQYSNNHGLV